VRWTAVADPLESTLAARADFQSVGRANPGSRRGQLFGGETPSVAWVPSVLLRPDLPSCLDGRKLLEPRQFVRWLATREQGGPIRAKHCAQRFPLGFIRVLGHYSCAHVDSKEEPW